MKQLTLLKIITIHVYYTKCILVIQNYRSDVWSILKKKIGQICAWRQSTCNLAYEYYFSGFEVWCKVGELKCGSLNTPLNGFVMEDSILFLPYE